MICALDNEGGFLPNLQRSAPAPKTATTEAQEKETRGALGEHR